MVSSVKKRSGHTVKFNKDKIRTAITKANKDVKQSDPTAKFLTKEQIDSVTQDVILILVTKGEMTTSIEEIQDTVEKALMSRGYYDVAKSYILYREKHRQRREASQKLLEQYQDLLFSDAEALETKRDNANIDGNSSMGIMLKLGTEGAKVFADNYGIPDKFVEAEKSGALYYHDKDFSFITYNCLQMDLSKVFKDGFSTGHGYCREPQSIRSYNDQFGGIAASGVDFTMAEGVRKSFKRSIKKQIEVSAKYFDHTILDRLSDCIKNIDWVVVKYNDETNKDYASCRSSAISDISKVCSVPLSIAANIYDLACEEVAEETKQAMEALVHNLNTLHSRAGSQTPFSSLSYGMDTSSEGRLVVRKLLDATWEGLGHGEIPIFPIQIYQIKAGYNYNPEDANYDLFKYAMKVSAKRLFPNFISIDSSFNLPYFKAGDYRTYACSMGCRTRVIGNVNGEELFTSRGNFAFVTLNLPHIALMADRDLNKFWKLFDKYIKIAKQYLEFRFEIIARKKVKNFPFTMLQKIYMGTEKLGPDDEVRGALKNATLSIGCCGLAECLIALIGKHHGESEEAQELGLKIIGRLRELTDLFTKQTHLNWSTFASPAESAASKLLRISRKQFGTIPGVTDKEYYTNSTHVPPAYNCTAFHKIQIEAPYHKLFNAGQIGYVEFPGDPLKNLDAFEKVVRAMHDADMGYFSVNHAVDRCTKCGYTGIIDNACPKCGNTEIQKHEEIIPRCNC